MVMVLEQSEGWKSPSESTQNFEVVEVAVVFWYDQAELPSDAPRLLPVGAVVVVAAEDFCAVGVLFRGQCEISPATQTGEA